MVRWLLRQGAASCVAGGGRGRTPLAAAAERGQKDAVEALLGARDACAAAAAVDADGRTVLELCGSPRLRERLRAWQQQQQQQEQQRRQDDDGTA